MTEYDFARRQTILSTGDNPEEWMAAGADPTELIGLGLLDSDDDFLSDEEKQQRFEEQQRQQTLITQPQPKQPLPAYLLEEF
jgi:hypothetical protein